VAHVSPEGFDFMKIAAIVLVSAVALYAIYDLFAGNLGLSSLFGTPGQTIPAGTTSIPGQPAYTNVAQPSNNLANGLETQALQVASTQFSDAFGSGGNSVDSSSEDDSDDFSDD
jgi:hypothetical protein